MIAMVQRAGKMNGGVAVSLIGWVVMAYAILHLGARSDIVRFGTLVVGFGLLEVGIALLIWAER